MYENKFVSAVICAAGSSSRMKSGVSKQLLSFGGMTVLERTVNAFENDGVTDEIIIVAPENLRDEFAALFASHEHTKKPLRFASIGAAFFYPYINKRSGNGVPIINPSETHDKSKAAPCPRGG